MTTTEGVISLQRRKMCLIPVASSLSISLQYCLAAASRLFVRRPEQALTVNVCNTADTRTRQQAIDPEDETLPEFAPNMNHTSQLKAVHTMQAWFC